MTAKSDSRRARDAKARAAAGGKLPSARVQREKFTRCWYELKTVHARSQNYIEQLGNRMRQYMHGLVLLKIAKNGDKERFDALLVQIQELAPATAAEFQSLWEMHGDKKKLCLSMTEFEQAMAIFDKYQAFDIDFFNTYQPIISELNQIFNKALGQLLEAKDKLAAETMEDAAAKLLDPTVVSDVNYSQVPDNLPTSIDGLAEPAKVARGENTTMVHIDELAFANVPGADVGRGLTEAVNYDDSNLHTTSNAIEEADKAGVDPSVRAGLINISE
jgi:hypothetical protein